MQINTTADLVTKIYVNKVAFEKRKASRSYS
jgi:hypothetical protein